MNSKFERPPAGQKEEWACMYRTHVQDKVNEPDRFAAVLSYVPDTGAGYALVWDYGSGGCLETPNYLCA